LAPSPRQLSGAQVSQHLPTFYNLCAPRRKRQPQASVKDPTGPGIETRWTLIDQLSQFFNPSFPRYRTLRWRAV
jgi:hypothetical protein